MIAAEVAWWLGAGLIVGFTVIMLVALGREWRKPCDDEHSDARKGAEARRPAALELARAASREARECGCPLHDTIATLGWVLVAQLDAIIEGDHDRLAVLLGQGNDLQRKLDELVRPERQPKMVVIPEEHLQRLAAAPWN